MIRLIFALFIFVPALVRATDHLAATRVCAQVLAMDRHGRILDRWESLALAQQAAERPFGSAPSPGFSANGAFIATGGSPSDDQGKAKAYLDGLVRALENDTDHQNTIGWAIDINEVTELQIDEGLERQTLIPSRLPRDLVGTGLDGFLSGMRWATIAGAATAMAVPQLEVATGFTAAFGSAYLLVRGVLHATERYLLHTLRNEAPWDPALARVTRLQHEEPDAGWAYGHWESKLNDGVEADLLDIPMHDTTPQTHAWYRTWHDALRRYRHVRTDIFFNRAQGEVYIWIHHQEGHPPEPVFYSPMK